MQNTIKTLKISNIIQIVAYLCMYAVAFCAYDSSKVKMFEGSDYQSLTIYVLAMLGLAFTLSMLRYRRVKKKTLLVGELILVYDILQMLAMIVATRKSFEMLEKATFANDKLSGLFSLIAIVMSGIIAMILVITVIMEVALGILKEQVNSTPEIPKVTTHEKGKSYIHIIVLATLIATYAFSSIYAYSIVGLLAFMWVFLIAFPLPCGLFFTIIVKEWIEKKKYIWAIGAYVLYMFLTYGVFHNLFNENVYGFSAGRNAMHIFGAQGIIGIINVIAAGVAVAMLVIKASRREK